MAVRDLLNRAVREHGRRGTIFLIVGLGGAFVDLGTFNVLVYWRGDGPMADHPVAAKALATLVATVATYFGNAWLTYRDRKAPMTGRRWAAYLGVNLTAILIQAGCLAFSRHVLGLDGPVADNVFGTGLGQVFATSFRYLAYARWVFPAEVDATDPRLRSGVESTGLDDSIDVRSECAVDRGRDL